MSKQPRYIIQFMEMHGYTYDPTTNQFKKPEESTPDFIKDCLNGKGDFNGR